MKSMEYHRQYYSKAIVLWHEEHIFLQDRKHTLYSLNGMHIYSQQIIFCGLYSEYF